jgi:hypothetical protein
LLGVAKLDHESETRNNIRSQTIVTELISRNVLVRNLYPDQDVEEKSQSNRLKLKISTEGAASRINSPI